MDSRKVYRDKAAKFDAYALEETNPRLKEDLEGLAVSYRSLAEQADRNVQANAVYETATQRVAQQQQQIQPKKPNGT
jgi:hypothetical protein